MTCAHCRGAGRVFSDRRARRELKRYTRRGPSKTTKLLIGALAGEEPDGMTLLDVGGGIGAVGYGLMDGGRLSSAVGVDASPAYVTVAREEAERRGLGDRFSHRIADLVDVAPEIEPADLVSMDRVLCCYPDVGRLLTAAATLARRRLGLVYPLDRWWIRVLMVIPNTYCRLTRNPFRAYVHDADLVRETAERTGLALESRQRVGIWLVELYGRPA